MPAAHYRLYRRENGTYYQQDNETGAQQSLRTKDKRAAQEKLRAANESVAQPRLNLDLARVYLRAHDTAITERIWADVTTAYSERGRDSSRERCRRAFAGKDFDPIRTLPLINTKAEHLLLVLATGKPSVNHYLRRLVHHAENLTGCLGRLCPNQRGRKWKENANAVSPWKSKPASSTRSATKSDELFTSRAYA